MGEIMSERKWGWKKPPVPLSKGHYMTVELNPAYKDTGYVYIRDSAGFIVAGGAYYNDAECTRLQSTLVEDWEKNHGKYDG